MVTQELNQEESTEELDSIPRGFIIFLVSVVLLVTVSLLLFFSTLRSRCIGIASGYLKAVELSYQTGELVFSKDFKDKDFETGIYKVKVSIRKNEEDGIINVKVSVSDKLLNINHYSEELKLITIPEIK